MPPRLIALLCVMGGTQTFTVGAFPALLPEIGGALALADWQLGVVAGAFGFARTVADVPVGLLVTHHVRRALVLAPLALAAGLLLVAAGGSFAVVTAGRALMGAGHTLGMLSALTVILRHAGPRLASSLNAYEFSAMCGILGGVGVVALVPGGLAWRVALLAAGAPVLASAVVVPGLLRMLPAAAARPLFATRDAARAGAAPGGGRGTAALAFAAGAGLAVTYATVEQFLIPIRGSREFGLERAGIARLLMVSQVLDIAALLPLGAVADRRGARPVLGAVLLAFATAMALVAFGGLPLVVIGSALFGFGLAGWMLPLGLLRAVTPPAQIAWRTALYRVSVDTGIFAGPVLSGALAAAYPAVLPVVLVAALAVLGALVLIGGRRR